MNLEDLLNLEDLEGLSHLETLEVPDNRLNLEDQWLQYQVLEDLEDLDVLEDL